MTECTTQRLLFHKHERRKVTAAFDGGRIGGQICVSVRRVWISLPESYPYQELFERVRQQTPQPLRL